MKIPKKILARQQEIFQEFLTEVDQHLQDILDEKVVDMFEIRDFADKLHIDARHLSNTIKLTTGNPPCYFFERKIVSIAKKMLAENKYTIAQIAIKLTYDPSNFTKFFKRFENQTPKQFRESHLISS